MLRTVTMSGYGAATQSHWLLDRSVADPADVVTLSLTNAEEALPSPRAIAAAVRARLRHRIEQILLRLDQAGLSA